MSTYDIDFAAHPEAYRIQPNEKGVFKVEPYKSALLRHWRFKDEAAARTSVKALCARYAVYCRRGDIVGMDMARKYLRMGFTRAMRYAKYPGGTKYRDDGSEHEPQQWADAEKRRAAVVFRNAWQTVLDDDTYQEMKAHHIQHVYDAEISPMA